MPVNASYSICRSKGSSQAILSIMAFSCGLLVVIGKVATGHIYGVGDMLETTAMSIVTLLQAYLYYSICYKPIFRISESSLYMVGTNKSIALSDITDIDTSWDPIIEVSCGSKKNRFEVRDISSSDRQHLFEILKQAANGNRGT